MDPAEDCKNVDDFTQWKLRAHIRLRWRAP